jgi:low affinity Fe/Cu permease
MNPDTEFQKQSATKPWSHVSEHFRRFAGKASLAAGSAWTFLAAVLFLILWAASYPLFRGPDAFGTWQLVINTATTIVTFLMVFLIQNTQNHDARVLHMKLDELIRAVKGARNSLVRLEDCSDEELESLHREFQRIHTESLRRQHTSQTHASPLDSHPTHS